MKYTLTPNSNKNIDYILKNYESKLNFEIKDTYFIKLLYTLLDRASDTIIEHDINTSDISLDILNIKKIIHHNIKFKIKDANYNVNIYTENEINLNKYIYIIKLILIMCSQHAITKYNVFTFKIILTDFKNEQPMPLSETNQDDHKEIILKKEEWLKCFIHECFHLFCLDFINDKDYSKLFKSLFNIENDFLLFDSLCDFWARTINIAIISYLSKKIIMYEEFEKQMTINIQIEKIYSILQMKYILSNMGITYESLINKTMDIPNSNLLCYYVLTPILFFYYEQTMGWFVEQDQTLLQFTKDNKSILLFFYYIKSIYKHTPLLDMIDSLNSYELTNNYMTVFEILI